MTVDWMASRSIGVLVLLEWADSFKLEESPPFVGNGFILYCPKLDITIRVGTQAITPENAPLT